MNSVKTVVCIFNRGRRIGGKFKDSKPIETMVHLIKISSPLAH